MYVGNQVGGRYGEQFSDFVSYFAAQMILIYQGGEKGVKLYECVHSSRHPT